VGTYRYMSPEQAAGGSVDARSDLFSFGTVLYELIGGSNPYEGDTHFATMRAIREDPLPRLRDRVPGLPKTLDDICRRASAKSPERRYQRAEALLGDVEDFARVEGLNLSPKRLNGFMRVVYGDSGIAGFGVTGTGAELRAAQTPAPRVPPRPTPEIATTPVPARAPVHSALPAEMDEPDAMPMEIDVDLDDIEMPVDLQPNPPREEPVGRTHPLDGELGDGDLGIDAPPLSSWSSDVGLRVALTLLVVALLAVAGWYWHWRSVQAGEAAVAAPLTAPPG